MVTRSDSLRGKNKNSKVDLVVHSITAIGYELSLMTCCTSKLTYDFSGMGPYDWHIQQNWHENFAGDHVQEHYDFSVRFQCASRSKFLVITI